MEAPAFGPPAAIPETGEAALEARPPGTARVETMLETVGIAIFAALLVSAAVILIRRNRR
ncbi:hypothetical protein BB934_43260 (plasmid) [Microvirga ossetica]|uniref:Uncharacterized protein n=1 Tax=Microvirga ossetica TaxID=1882682 RepID=A0A1B2EYL3_9HYPH|nr:hypothetical protein [Microvirga ossetica]ANY85033.1 hypothetical protein BB934_43260 [Microvirga ossetica]